MPEPTPPWYEVTNINEVDSPALLIYPNRVKENIRTAIGMIGDVARLRPHVKTNKSIEATRLLLAAGIQKFKCATISEAEMLGICKAPDVLLAYQPIGPKVKRLATIIKKYPGTQYSCLVDNRAAAIEMARVFAASGLEVPVYIDLNTGMNRTGILPGIPSIQLYKDCATMKGIIPVGLHAYDGHIRDAEFSARQIKCEEAFTKVVETREALKKEKLSEPAIVIGGSPTFSIHCKRKDVQCTPGTFIYWDKGYSDLCPEQSFLTAALIITRVISLPSSTRLCLDLGHKSIAPENELGRRVYFLNAPDLKPVSQSEEHLVVDAGPAHQYKTGDIFYGLPIHICPTVALYERAVIIEKGKTSGEWKTEARDKKLEV